MEKIKSALRTISRDTSLQLLFLITVLFLSSALLREISRGNRTVGIDYFHYWIAGEVLRTDFKHSIYTDEGRGKVREFALSKAQEAKNQYLNKAANFRDKISTTGTPFFYSIFKYLNIGDYDTDRSNYNKFSLLLYYLSLILLILMLRLSIAEGLGFLIIASALNPPFQIDTNVLNCNKILSALLIFAFCTTKLKNFYNKYILFGAVSALCILFKLFLAPLPIFMTLLLVYKKEYKAFTLFASSGVLTSLFAILWTQYLFGSTSLWVDWYNALPKGMGDVFYENSLAKGNFSLSFFFYHFTNIDLKLPILGLLLLSFVFYLFKSKNSIPTAEQERLSVCLSCLSFLMLSPLVWYHYFTLFLPILIYLYSNIKHMNKHKTAFFIAMSFPFLFWQLLNAFIASELNCFLAIGIYYTLMLASHKAFARV